MTKRKRLNFNQDAPDITLVNTAAKPVQLSDIWAQQPMLLAFTRHFGCTQCKEMLDELVAERERIEAAGLKIVVVMQDTPEKTAQFAKKFAPGLLSLSDPDRKAYQAYGLERGNIFQTFLNLRVVLAVRNARKKGYKVEHPPAGQDAMQMSGTFIISKTGQIELPYYYDHIADHPSVDLLLSGVLSTRWDHDFNGPVGPADSPRTNRLEKSE